MSKISLTEIGEKTLHWNCQAKNAQTGDLIAEGRATRVYARINEDGNLSSAAIPDYLRKVLSELGQLKQLGGSMMS